MKKIIIIVFSVLFLLSTFSFGNEINKSFSAKEELEIELILGDCEILKSNDNKIHVNVDYSYSEDIFKAVFKEKNDKLLIEEKFEDNDDNDGESIWKISIPDGMEVEFSSATGCLTLKGINAKLEGSSGTGCLTGENLSGEYELGSGTGNIEVTDSEGDFELNSGTGNVKISNSKGEFDANSGTGKVIAENIIILDSADFGSGTGKVEVSEIKGKDFDLEIGSGTGNVELDLKGKTIDGHYILETRDKIGRISCPFKFDNEEKFEDGNSKKIRKSFTIGKSSTEISLSSGTGKVVLKK
ncbi:hypothetical protein HNV12_05075 [Methanococcoides sp. SA1]|nr:hypothetical protein [Methanococcoides sp. SA1]